VGDDISNYLKKFFILQSNTLDVKQNNSCAKINKQELM